MLDKDETTEILALHKVDLALHRDMLIHGKCMYRRTESGRIEYARPQSIFVGKCDG